MFKKFAFLFLLCITYQLAIGQNDFGGKLFVERIPKTGVWQQCIAFDEKHDTVYVLDAQHEVARFYGNRNWDDNMQEFYTRCPHHTEFTFGPGKDKLVRELTNGMEDGYYLSDQQGFYQEGKMDNSNRVGWWKYKSEQENETWRKFHTHDRNYDQGISLSHHIIPGILLLLIYGGLAIYLIRNDKYKHFYILLFCTVIFSVLGVISTIGVQPRGILQTLALIDRRSFFVCIMKILLVVNPLLSIYNFVSSKRDGVLIALGIFTWIFSIVMWIITVFIENFGKIGG